MSTLAHLWRSLLSAPLRLRWLACSLYLALIAVLSLLPASLFPPSATSLCGADKVVHVLMYGGLVSLLRWGTHGIPAATGTHHGILPLWPLGAAFSYGLLMELLQALCTHGQREFGWDDVAANTTGSVIFWFISGRILSSLSGKPS